MDELTGIGNYEQFRASGGREYDPLVDAGRHNNFWDRIHDAEKNKEREYAVIKLFAQKYKMQPWDLPEPAC